MEEIERSNFGEIRKQHHITMQDVANRAGIAISTVEYFERRLNNDYVRGIDPRDKTGKLIIDSLKGLIAEGHKSKNYRDLELSNVELIPFVKNLERYLAANNLSKREFSAMCGFHYSALSKTKNIKAGKNSPYMTKVMVGKIVNATGWSMEDIRTGAFAIGNANEIRETIKKIEETAKTPEEAKEMLDYPKQPLNEVKVTVPAEDPFASEFADTKHSKIEEDGYLMPDDLESAQAKIRELEAKVKKFISEQAEAGNRIEELSDELAKADEKIEELEAVIQAKKSIFSPNEPNSEEYVYKDYVFNDKKAVRESFERELGLTMKEACMPWQIDTDIRNMRYYYQDGEYFQEYDIVTHRVYPISKEDFLEAINKENK